MYYYNKNLFYPFDLPLSRFYDDIKKKKLPN